MALIRAGCPGGSRAPGTYSANIGEDPKPSGAVVAALSAVTLGRVKSSRLTGNGLS
jgi:hypothetical protein